MKQKVYSLLFVVYSWVLISLLFSTHCFAQSERKLVRDGNKLYKEKKYTDAEVKYMKSLNVNKESKTAKFNLGDAYYKQDKYDEASQQFSTIASDKSLSKDEQARAYHNLGNSLVKAKKYDESLNAYKNSLKLNPKDNDTRYNLAYAQSMLKQQQQQQQKKDDKNKDQKDKDQQKQDQQKQGDQKKDQKQGDEKQEQQQQAQKKQGISKEDAEKMLQALNNDEKNTQKKMVKKPTSRVSVEKQW